jgi:arginine:ornithine antiporter/lysine permease
MIQIFLLITLFSAGTYTSLIYLASSMILVPYLWSAAYAVLLSGRGKPMNMPRPSAPRTC